MVQPPNIALIGRARTGKDTIAARLVQRCGYARVAFADPVRDMALAIDPLITWAANDTEEDIRLSEIVQNIGWESAKDDFPEVRRLLQRIGEGVREHDQDYWLNIARGKIATQYLRCAPVVVTDCRYLNEALALRKFGFTLIRVVRPGTETANAHVSETDLDGLVTDATIGNNGSLDTLNWRVDCWLRSLTSP